MNRLSLVWSPLTYLMEQSASWEANQFSSSLETHWISWNRKVHYYIHSCPSPFNLYQFHFLFWAYHSWGIKQGLGIVTCNIDDSVVIGLVCVFIEVFLTALSFRGTYCPHLQSLCSIHASALCSWVPFGGTWEHNALVWVGYKFWRWGKNLPCGVYCFKSWLFSSLGRTLSESWMDLHWGGRVPGVWT